MLNVMRAGARAPIGLSRLQVAMSLRAERLDASGVAMIGDRAHDVLGARACGVSAIGALWGYGSHAELTEAGAHALAAVPAEIAAALAAALPRNSAAQC